MTWPINLEAFFATQCREVETEHGTKIPKHVQVAAYQSFERGCKRAHEAKGETVFRSLFPVQGPQYARHLLGLTLQAYCKGGA